MLFGADKVLEGTVEQAHAAVKDIIARIDPLLTHVFMMGRSLAHGLLNRFDVKIHIELKPDPGPNPAPKEDV